MTTLITGATGFLGGHILDRLLERGDSVRALTRSFDIELADRGVEIIEGDLTNTEDIRRATQDVEVVYHLAGRVERDPENAHEMYALHVDGSRKLFDALREQDNLRAILYASSSGTVGVGTSSTFIADDDSPMVENIARRWPYYLSKIYAERVAQRFVKDYQLPIRLMRPTLLLGPGDRRESSTGDIVNFLRRRIPSTPSGGLSFVDVRDVADAFLAAEQMGQAGETYLLGACNLSFAKYFRRLEHLSDVPAPRLPIPDAVASFGVSLLDKAMRAVGSKADIDPASFDMAQHYWYIDWQKAVDALGFSPRNSNETLRDTIRWIRENHPEFATERQRERLPEDADFVPGETLEWLEQLKKG